MINAVGSIAGFAGPYVFGYLNTRTGSLSSGLIAMLVSSVAGVVLLLCTTKSTRTIGPVKLPGRAALCRYSRNLSQIPAAT